MVTYLLSTGYTSTHIGALRTVSVIFEISATWIAPRVMAGIGPVRAGIWFVNWQMMCLAIAMGLFSTVHSPLLSASCLIAGVIPSRVGLWGFDLSVQVIIQEVRSMSR
jgi:iron-regulated transporter 1